MIVVGIVSVIVVFLIAIALKSAKDAVTGFAWGTLGTIILILLGIAVVLVVLYFAIPMIAGWFGKAKPTAAAPPTTPSPARTTPPTSAGQRIKNVFGWAGAAFGASIAMILALPFLVLGVVVITLLASGLHEAFHNPPPVRSGIQTIPATSAAYHSPNDIERYPELPSTRFNGPDKDSLMAFLKTLSPRDSMLAEFAACESGFTQYDYSEPDSALHGKTTRHDIGILQENMDAHGDEIKRLGYDVTKLNDNMAYGALLFEREGSNPWNSSAWCWRDHFKTRPLLWTFDRTPEQMIEGTTQNALEVVIADAPSDTTWSTLVETYGRPMQIEASDKGATFEVLVHGEGDKLDTVKIGPGVHDTLKFTPRAYQVRRERSDSLAPFLPILFTRGK